MLQCTSFHSKTSSVAPVRQEYAHFKCISQLLIFKLVWVMPIKAISQLIAAVIAFFAVRGLDQIFGKWLAALVIAWEKTASDSARKAYNDSRNQLILELPDKWQAWEDWRNSHRGH